MCEGPGEGSDDGGEPGCERRDLEPRLTWFYGVLALPVLLVLQLQRGSR